MDKAWKVIKDASTKFQHFEVVSEDVITSQGNSMVMEYVKMRPGVCILPLLDGGTRVVCIRQYRHILRDWQWELPAGGLDEGVEPLEMAKRELAEETGYIAQKWTSLGSVYPSFGSTDQIIHLFAAEDLTMGQQRLEPGEEIEVVSMPIEQFRELVQNGQFQHGAGLACVARWWAMGNE